jgi:hypothetical protein
MTTPSIGASASKQQRAREQAHAAAVLERRAQAAAAM